MPRRSRARRRPRAPRKSDRAVAIYPYRDHNGRLIYQVARYEPKNFAFLKPDGRPWTARKRRPLLYRLPELLAAHPEQVVYVVEGEKDVDRLRSMGLVATCNAGGGGRGKWSLAHSRHLRGRSVVILADNDQTGREHAEDVAFRLRRAAKAIRIVDLPNLPHKGDVSDWLNSGRTAEELVQFCEDQSLWEYQPAQPRLSSNFDERYNFALGLERIINAKFSSVEKLLMIIVNMGGGREESPSQEALAATLGVTERRVRQLVSGLKGRGVLHARRGRGGNHYYLSHYFSN